MHLVGSGLIIAGSAALNNLIDRDIDPVMTRTKSRPTVTGRFKAPAVLALALTFIVVGEVLLFSASVAAGLMGTCRYLQLCCTLFDVVETEAC